MLMSKLKAAIAVVLVLGFIVSGAMVLSGAVAGLVAMQSMLGTVHAYGQAIPSGFGFAGISVALLGRNHPAGIVPAARPHRADRVERCSVFVWSVQRGGVVVCPTSREPTQRLCDYLARQRPRGFFRRDICRSTLAVGGMGFCDARPKRYLYKTTESFTETATARPHSSRLAA